MTITALSGSMIYVPTLKQNYSHISFLQVFNMVVDKHCFGICHICQFHTYSVTSKCCGSLEGIDRNQIAANCESNGEWYIFVRNAPTYES